MFLPPSISMGAAAWRRSTANPLLIPVFFSNTTAPLSTRPRPFSPNTSGQGHAAAQRLSKYKLSRRIFAVRAIHSLAPPASSGSSGLARHQDLVAYPAALGQRLFSPLIIHVHSLLYSFPGS